MHKLTLYKYIQCAINCGPRYSIASFLHNIDESIGVEMVVSRKHRFKDGLSLRGTFQTVFAQEVFK